MTQLQFLSPLLLISSLALGCAKPPSIDRAGGVVAVYELEGAANEGATPDSATLDALKAVLKQRLDPSGARGVVVEIVEGKRVSVTLPNTSPKVDERIFENEKRLISAPGRLELRIVANPRDHAEAIEAAGKFVDKEAKRDDASPPATEEVDEDGTTLAKWVRIGRDERTAAKSGDAAKQGVESDLRPLKFTPYSQHTIRDAATGKPIAIPDDVDFNDRFPDQPEYRFERWLAEQGVSEVDVLVAADDGYDVSGKHFQKAVKTYDDLAMPMVSFEMTKEGAIRLGGLTSDYLPEETGFARQLAIVLDGELLSAPSIRGAINDRGQITGNFTEDEAERLVRILSAGELPLALSREPVSVTRVAPAGVR